MLFILSGHLEVGVAVDGVDERGRLREVTAVFLKLGTIAFGGPAAHIAMMRDEVVNRRGWVTEGYFLDLLGASNIIPGPNSTEMTIHLGYQRAGRQGLVVAGVAFILPAFLIVLAIAALYVRYGTLPEAQWLLYGIKPAILAVVVQALWKLGKTAVRGPLTAAVGIAALAAYFLRVNELLILAVGALALLVARSIAAGRAAMWLKGVAWAGPGAPSLWQAAVMLAQAAAPPTPADLFWTFLRIGSVLYGSGYVLLAFMYSDFVAKTGWLTQQQLLDAIAVGQFTPGPVFTTATFVGYIMAGWQGAVAATVGIFLPAFFFVWLTHPYVARVRSSTWAAPLLDGVNVASLALMAGVTWRLGQAAVIDWFTIIIAAVATVALLRYRVNSAWLVLGGGLAGLAYRYVMGG